MDRSKFDGFVYLCICEEWYSIIENLKTFSFRNGSKYVRQYIENAEIGVVQKYIDTIYVNVNRIFNFSLETMYEYIFKFFLLDKYLQYEDAVKALKSYFGGYIKTETNKNKKNQNYE